MCNMEANLECTMNVYRGFPHLAVLHRIQAIHESYADGDADQVSGNIFEFIGY